MPKKTEQTQPSVGTFALVETRGGQLKVHLDVSFQENTHPDLRRRIQAALAGLHYLYERDGDRIDAMGLAFLEGMEEGIERTQKEATSKKKGGYKDTKIGFTAEVKND
jgi:hypothetical protein